jgi:hypothetical protein
VQGKFRCPDPKEVLNMYARLTALLICCCSLALAQDVSQEQRKLLARRAAEADAYRKLAEAVYGLQINSRTYVRDFVTESDEIRGDLDAFIRGIRLGQPTWYEDGSCEVPAEVTVAKVVETLRSAHERYYKGEDIKTSDFESMSRRLEKKVIRVVGVGAPRPDLPPDLPEGVPEQLGPPPPEIPPAVPDIWRQIGPQATLSAKRAAELDAYRRLAERIKGLRLTANTRVRDFIAESDVITAEMEAFLKGAEIRGYYLHSDELIAECTVRVPTEQVITTIKELYSRHYKGDDIRGSDVENIVRTVVKKDFEATGMGIPNPRFIQKFVETSQTALPDWALQSLEAEGEGTDPQMDTPQGRLRAARAAEMDARRKLAERIAGLQLDARTVIRDFTAQHEEVAARLDAIIVDALVTQTRFTDGRAVVTVSIPGMRVWEAINEQLRRTRR